MCIRDSYEAAEVSGYGKMRLTAGINPQSFSWLLAPWENFAAPEAVMAYSCEGYNGMSQCMHAFVREHIVRGAFKPVSYTHLDVYKRQEKRLETGWETTIQLLEQGMAEGVVRKVSIPIVKMMLEATVEQFFQRDILIQSRLSYLEALDEVVSILVNGIVVPEAEG